MRILFVNRIAWPDEGATALYLTDVAEACAAAGHEVHVLCGEASYRAAHGSDVVVPRRIHRGVRYNRIPGPRGRTMLGRALGSARFLLHAGFRMLRLRRPDIVIALTDPPFVDVVAGAVGRLRGSRMVHWQMDAYPDIAAAAGVVPAQSAVYRALAAVMGGALRCADAVVVLSPRMRRPVLARGVSRHRIHVIENWAPEGVEVAAQAAPPARPPRALTLLYSGTYGAAHDLGPLFDALRILPPTAPVRLILQVSGSRLVSLRHEAEGLPIEVVWRQPVPLRGLASSLRDGDVHVSSVAAGFERLVTPSKVYAPLALGLPVLAVGARGGWADARGVIRQEPASIFAHAPSDFAALARVGTFVTRSSTWPKSRAQGIRAWLELLLRQVGAPRRRGVAPPCRRRAS